MSNEERLLASDLPLSEPQREILRTLIGSIIPASRDYDAPGADDPLIFKDILVTARSYTDMFEAGLEDIDPPRRPKLDGLGSSPRTRP